MMQQFGSIYLDHNATTPLHSEVARVLRQHLEEPLVGNPSSLHRPGRRGRALIEEAREELSLLLGVDPSELYFTSGGTESNNAMLLGIAESDQPLWISATEHQSVREAAKKRWAQGAPCYLGRVCEWTAAGLGRVWCTSLRETFGVCHQQWLDWLGQHDQHLIVRWGFLSGPKVPVPQL